VPNLPTISKREEWDRIVLRIDRAKAHLDDFDAAVKAWYQEPDIGGIADPEYDAKRRKYLWRLRLVAPPAHLGLIAGDFVHNLRASLDNIIWSLATPRLRRDNEGTLSFPVCTTSPDLSKEMRKFRNFPEDIKATIGRFQPYGRTNPPLGDPLAQLNRLWNRDKHRAPLLVSVVAGTLMSWEIVPSVPMAGRDRLVFHGPRSGTMLTRLKKDGSVIAATVEPKLENEPDLKFSVALGEGGDFLRDELVPALFFDLHRHVADEIAPAFEPFFR
jgi:hypothetical protein